jgi:hypothetical protein
MRSRSTAAVIEPRDLLPVEIYDRRRTDYRRHVVELKRRRRVAVGPHLSLLFESRETVLSQIQEVVWLERPLREERVAEEIAEYDPLIPRRGELTATLMIHSGPPGAGRTLLSRFLSGARRVIFLSLGGATFDAQPLWPDDDPDCPVQYVGFVLDAGAMSALRDPDISAQLGIEYCGDLQCVALPAETRHELAGYLVNNAEKL